MPECMTDLRIEPILQHQLNCRCHEYSELLLDQCGVQYNGRPDTAALWFALLPQFGLDFTIYGVLNPDVGSMPGNVATGLLQRCCAALVLSVVQAAHVAY